MSADLIARLEKLTVPDREVDAAICILFGTHRAQERDGETVYARRYPDDEWSTPGRGYDPFMLVPELTASLDEAVALAERVLPGWHIARMGEGPNETPRSRSFKYDGTWFVELHCDTPGVLYNLKYGSAPTPAIALCIAILKALSSSDSKR